MDDMNKIREQMRTPAGSILMWSFNLSGEINDNIRDEIPQIRDYIRNQDLGNFLQFATILGTLLRVERYIGSYDYTKLHQSIIESIAPSMRDTYVPPLLRLTNFLLQRDSEEKDGDTLPSLEPLLHHTESELSESIGHWIVREMKQAPLIDPVDLKIASILGELVFKNNAQFIASIMLSDEDPIINRIV